ncbi:MAG: peptidylprolyl isomerase [Flavobacteriaceae bacterium]
MKTKLLKLLFLSVVLAACNSKYDTLEDGVYADIETAKGSIILELYAKDAPMTVANFITLAEGTNPKVSDSLKGKKYYNGIKFHRVVKNFVIQGGDPAGSGLGGPGYKFQDEFPKDSTGNLLYKHDSPGVLSMANPGPPSTNGSQFFITHRAIPHLDGKHSVFGKVVIGQNVVDSIAQNDVITSVKIIRKGTEAKNFDAVKAFNEGMANFPKLEKERIAKMAEVEKARYETYLKNKEVFYKKMDVSKAKKTNSGLQFLKLKKTSGKKVVENKPTTVNYTLYFADGRKFQSTLDKGGKPFTFQLDDKQRPVVPGFKEGMLQLRQGEKARIFIPYYLGWGERGSGPIPPKMDVIFDIEVLKVGK